MFRAGDVNDVVNGYEGFSEVLEVGYEHDWPASPRAERLDGLGGIGSNC